MIEESVDLFTLLKRKSLYIFILSTYFKIRKFNEPISESLHDPAIIEVKYCRQKYLVKDLT